tara:strand:+ start:3585 stop:4106 length:522 start_codon:yes stop_codon:yes gene_type:complete
LDQREKQPRWQEGDLTVEATLPADRTQNGREESIEIGFIRKSEATHPMTHEDRIDWEIEIALRKLSRAERASQSEVTFTMRDLDALSDALDHSVWAWCRVHLSRVGPSSFDVNNAFLDEAPETLSALTNKARSAIHRLRWFATVRPAAATELTKAAVVAVLKASGVSNAARFM